MKNSGVQDIYLRQIDEKAANEIELELLLPTIRGEVVGNSENDFELIWRGGKREKKFPNKRKHFVKADESGLHFWSTVRAHFTSVSIDNNRRELKIRRTGETELLGSWRFITEQPSGDVKVRLSKSLAKIGQLAQVTVDIDLSEVKPPVNLDDVSLSIGETKLENTAKFLRDRSLNQTGKFKFSYNDLAEKLEGNKVGTHKIQISVKTFFGNDKTAMASLEITKPDPKPIKVKPEPVLVRVESVHLNFENAPESWERGDDFTSLTIDGKTVPWNLESNLGAEQIKASRKYSLNQVHLHHIKQGKHKVQVKATINGSGFVAAGTIEVEKNEQEFTLKLVKNPIKTVFKDLEKMLKYIATLFATERKTIVSRESQTKQLNQILNIGSER